MKGKPIFVTVVVVLIFVAVIAFTPIGQTIFNQAPIAEAGPDKTVMAKKPLVFDGTGSMDPDGSIVRYLWNFGDGVSSEGEVVSHVYANPGSYTVTLTVTDNLGATATDTCRVTVTYVYLKTNIDVPSKVWLKNPTTDLPECVATITYKVTNYGTASDTVNLRLLVDGVTVKQQSFLIDPRETIYGQHVTTVGYDTSHKLELRAEGEESSDSYSLRFTAALPRFMPLEYAKLFITPKDPIVIQKEGEITTNWLVPDIVELRNWVAQNIRYRYDESAHGVSDYWQLPHETLSLGTGDCEDFSILLCTLLRANGYGSNDVYVMVGKSTSGETGHAWVVCRTDLGTWWTIEPQIITGEDIIWNILNGQITDLSGYKAYCLFNDEEFHLID